MNGASYIYDADEGLPPAANGHGCLITRVKTVKHGRITAFLFIELSSGEVVTTRVKTAADAELAPLQLAGASCWACTFGPARREMDEAVLRLYSQACWPTTIAPAAQSGVKARICGHNPGACSKSAYRSGLLQWSRKPTTLRF